jgi:ubiquinone/menaquinone biosynthesis C-methylase UbiE
VAEHLCPWWGGYFLDNRLRRWLHQPEKILTPFLEKGMSVLDFGCGMGLFSIAAARLVGETGQVTSVDLQPRMLSTLRKRAAKVGLADRIQTHACPRDSLGIRLTCHFAIAFWSLHETPDQRVVLAEIFDALREGGRLLVAEPRGHVTGKAFDEMGRMAEDVGFQIEQQPHVRLSRAVALLKDRAKPA